ncbi:MAG: hypothetical protein IPH31_21935 [Lewinellaceae bacterium]|nr:hypothetical protein [Lewinellaceae bacterium]
MSRGKAIITLEGHSSAVRCVAFSPDGNRLATGTGDVDGQDETVKIWDLNLDVLIRHAQENRLAGLTLPQLQAYNLELLLDFHPDNETKLIATREVWQIKAFADLAAVQAAGSTILSNVEPSFARAERLYAAALALQDEVFIRENYADALRRWAVVCKSNGLEGQGSSLEAKAKWGWTEKEITNILLSVALSQNCIVI